jgi:NADPH-dependent ferric siderophore reductase
MSPADRSIATRIRREPPTFRRVKVRRVERLTSRMLRVTLTGPELEGLVVNDPAASVRMLIPSPGADALVIPTWNGNEFLLPDGSRPIIRTFTPFRVDPDALELELWVVIHDGGIASAWAAAAEAGDGVAISGPGRGYAIDPTAPTFLLGGDESAIPAIIQLLELLPEAVPVQVHIEVAHPDARLALPEHAGATAAWHDLPADATSGDALSDAVRGADIDPGARIWVAGEAAAVQRIRKHLFDDRSFPRNQTAVRGYWKHGRGGDPDD